MCEMRVLSREEFQSTPSAWRETPNVFVRVQIPLHFNPLPPHGGRQITSKIVVTPFAFQSTPSAWRETRICGAAEWNQRHFNPLPPHGGRHIAEVQKTLPSAISIHSLRMEGDRVHHLRIQRAKNFNPLPPHGGRRLSLFSRRKNMKFQSTPSAWRETRWPVERKLFHSNISIHSLRMEGDIMHLQYCFLK